LPCVVVARRIDADRRERLVCAQAIDKSREILRDANYGLVELGLGEPIEPGEHGHRQAIVEAVTLAPDFAVADDRIDIAVQRA